MKRKILTMALAFALCLGITAPAFAAEDPAEIGTAAAFLRERGIMLGDAKGDMQLERGLSRAELATLLSRLHGGASVNTAIYDWACYFTDVPAWAKPYVGYCVANLLVTGYDETRYGPNDPVSPAMACTVVLRCCGYGDGEGIEWTYATASEHAAGLGLISQSTARAATITRGEVAVLICRALNRQSENAPPQTVTVPSGYQSSPGGGVTISQNSWSREDFSRNANPEVFTGPYTRELYNAIRQTLVDIGTENSTGDRCAYTMVSKNDYSAVKQMVGRMDGLLWYEHYVPQNLVNYYEYPDYFALSAQMPESYEAAYNFIQPVIGAANRMGSDREKVKYLNDYLCSLLTYDERCVAGISRTFAPHSEELKGICSDYTHNFKFLCAAAGIPCFTISSTNHSWNLVYADGRWLHVDVTANDAYHRDYILLAETVTDHTDRAPEATEFLKELLVPGSTK